MDIYKYINITLVFIIYIILLYYANLFFNIKHNKIINAINKQIFIENFELCEHEYNYNSVNECNDNISPKCKNEDGTVDPVKTAEYCNELHFYKDVLKSTNSSCDDIANYRQSLGNIYCFNEEQNIKNALNTQLNKINKSDSTTPTPSTPTPSYSDTSTPSPT